MYSVYLRRTSENDPSTLSSGRELEENEPFRRGHVSLHSTESFSLIPHAESIQNKRTRSHHAANRGQRSRASPSKVVPSDLPFFCEIAGVRGKGQKKKNPRWTRGTCNCRVRTKVSKRREDRRAHAPVQYRQTKPPLSVLILELITLRSTTYLPPPNEALCHSFRKLHVEKAVTLQPAMQPCM